MSIEEQRLYAAVHACFDGHVDTRRGCCWMTARTSIGRIRSVTHAVGAASSLPSAHRRRGRLDNGAEVDRARRGGRTPPPSPLAGSAASPGRRDGWCWRKAAEVDRALPCTGPR